MALVYLVHWNEEETAERVGRLQIAGHDAEAYFSDYKTLRLLIKQTRPDAVVIDLSRLPSHGREVAESLRSTKANCGIPIVFVDGQPEKVKRAKQQFPDATYCVWSRIGSAVDKAITSAPKNPKPSSSALAGYSGTPLPKKLGIKPGFVVAIINGPENFEKTLGKLPNDVTLRTSARGRNDLMIWFPKDRADYEKRVVKVRNQFGDGGLWVCWPKKASGVETDLSGAVIRMVGIASGLVDFKVCAVDATYSAHKFARKKNN
ncbi:MAG: hypothetical protein AB8G99_11510 [Planctomycetaceae bacterium]